MKRISVVSLFLFAFASFAHPLVFAQNATRHTIQSMILGEERSIIVRVPPSYSRGTNKYPLVYMLDGHEPHLMMMAGILDQQSSAGRIPEMILVGIQNTDRTRDLTPTKTQRQNSGGGVKFLDFISSEVMPLVEKTYRTEKYKVFAGHSLGGLMVVYASNSRPALFDGYIAASPVLHWDNNFPVRKTEEFLKAKQERKKPLFIAIGDEPDYIAGYNSMKGLLKKRGSDAYDAEFQQWMDEDHGSIVLRAYLFGLRKVYADWPPPRSGSLSDVETHYKKLAKKYGYEILAPEDLMNQIGYGYLRQNNTDEAIRVFKRNTEIYPNSANVYDSLAEAYERSGSMNLAKDNYERAFRMAEQQGNTQLSQSSKAKWERLAKKK